MSELSSVAGSSPDSAAGGWYLQKCVTPAEWRMFENAAELLYHGERDFVPPLPGSIVRHLQPDGHFQTCHGPVQGWLVWKEDRLLGRLAGVVNRSHNLYHGDRVGFFGYPALASDPTEAAAAFKILLRAVEQWLGQEHGCESVRGPYNPSINEECGLLIEGFNGPPILGMTWNPPGTEAFFLAAGLERVREMVAFQLDLRLGEPERVKRVRERIAQRHALTFRHLRLGNLYEDLTRLQRLYNVTLDRNWGFVPMRYDDFLESAAEFRSVVDPRLILLVESRGYPAAFAMSLPNFNEILWQARRVPKALRWPFLGLKMLTHRYTSCRLAVLGIAPEFRAKGLTGWLFGEMQRRTSQRFRSAEISWVEANNQEIIEGSYLMGCVPYRRYAIFEKTIPAEPGEADPRRANS